MSSIVMRAKGAFAAGVVALGAGGCAGGAPTRTAGPVVAASYIQGLEHGAQSTVNCTKAATQEINAVLKRGDIGAEAQWQARLDARINDCIQQQRALANGDEIVVKGVDHGVALGTHCIEAARRNPSVSIFGCIDGAIEAMRTGVGAYAKENPGPAL